MPNIASVLKEEIARVARKEVRGETQRLKKASAQYMAFARSVADYKGEVRRNHSLKATYFLEWAVQRPDVPRVLEWFVPKDGVRPEQELALRQVVEEGARLGVEVKLFRVTT